MPLFSLLLITSSCSIQCLKRNRDQTGEVPRAVRSAAAPVLDCPAAQLSVTVSSVPYGGGWMARGCGRAAVFTCGCAGGHEEISECQETCLQPACDLYGCAESATLMRFAREKCQWKASR